MRPLSLLCLFAALTCGQGQYDIDAHIAQIEQSMLECRGMAPWIEMAMNPVRTSVGYLQDIVQAVYGDPRLIYRTEEIAIRMEDCNPERLAMFRETMDDLLVRLHDVCVGITMQPSTSCRCHVEDFPVKAAW